MIKMFATGWDGYEDTVARWLEEGEKPTAVYETYEEAVKNAYEDADVDCDEHIYFVYEDGKIEEFTAW